MRGDEVSPKLRSLQIGASILFCFTIAGLIFGFAALKPVLIDAGVYADSCVNASAPCKKQDTRLNLLFSVASSTTNIAALPAGIFLDRVGPKVSSITGGLIFGLGSVVFALRIVHGWMDTYLIGYALMALGAPAMFLAQFHLSNAFPARSGLILGAITGAFDASSLPLVFYKLAYFGHDGKPNLRTFFLCYTAIPALLIVHQLFLGPPAVYTRPGPTEDTSTEPQHLAPPEPRRPSLSPSNSKIALRRGSSSFSRISYPIHDDAEVDEIKLVLEGKREDGIVGAMFGRGAWEQIRSSWWLAMFGMVVVHMTRINWYMATVNTQLVYYTSDEDLADTLTDGKSHNTRVSPAISDNSIHLSPPSRRHNQYASPPIGYLLDTQPVRRIVIIMGITALAFGTLGLVRNTVAQLIGIALLTVFRPLFYTAISDYAAKVFGWDFADFAWLEKNIAHSRFETFGTVYGLAMTLSGLFGLILTPLDILTKGPLNGSFTPVNTVLLLCGFTACTLLYIRTRSAPRIKLPAGDDALDNVIAEEEGEE